MSTQNSFICPRCGIPSSKHPALSRRVSVNICSGCGTREALEDAGLIEKLDVSKWVVPQKGENCR